jgi:hypothetical protein
LGFTLIFIWAVNTAIFAQNEDVFQLERGGIMWSVSTGGGYAPVLYENSRVGNSTVEFDKQSGLLVDANVSYLLSDILGVSLGLAYSSYNTQATIASYSDEINDLLDSDNMRYTLYVDTDNATEKHELSYLDIPIKMQMHLPISEKIMFTGGVGFKLGIPISSTYSLEESNFTTEAFYPDLNFLLVDYSEQDLYTNRSDWHPPGNIDTKLNFALVAEGGVLWALNNKLAVSAKAYFSYGLNKSINNQPNNHLVEEYAKYNGLQSFLGDARLMQLGVKIGVVGIFSKMP